jgi:hypothetical protein
MPDQKESLRLALKELAVEAARLAADIPASSSTPSRRSTAWAPR